jgi:hypothetical protein
MDTKLAALAVFALAISLVGNAYAHKDQVLGDYKVSVGWTKEPPVAGKANAIEINIAKASASEKKSTTSHEGHDAKADKKTKSTHDEKKTTKKKPTHDHKSAGIKGLAKSLEVDITLNDKKTILKMVEDKKKPGRYTAEYTPEAEGHPTVHIYAKIKTTEIEGSFHPEKVEAQ